MFVVTVEALDVFRSGDRIILCREDLVDEFRAIIKPTAQIISFRDGWIGDATESAIASLDEVGFPPTLEVVVAPRNCAVAARIHDQIRVSNHLTQVPDVHMDVQDRVARSQRETDLRVRYCAAIEKALSGLEAQEQMLSEKIVSLRKRVEAETRAVNHASGFLGMLGVRTGDAEVFPATPQFPGISDLSQGSSPILVAGAWGEYQGSGIYGGVTGAAVKTRSGITPMDADSLLAEDHILAHTGIGSLHILPAKAPIAAFAEARDAKPGAFVAAGMRWTEANLSGHVKGGPRGARLPIPNSTENGLAAGAVPRKRAWSLPSPKGGEVGQDGNIVMTTFSSYPVKYVLRDLSVVGLRSLSATVLLESRGRARAVAVLVPETELHLVDDQIRAAAISVGTVGRMQVADVSSHRPTVLEIDTTGLPTDRRYSLVLAVRGGHLPRKVRARWLSICRHDGDSQDRYVYQSVRFGDLARRFEFGDGAERENELNSSGGFPLLTTGPDGAYFQTHPVVNRIVSARALNLIPAGCTRIWVQAANAHELAQPTEFGIVIGGPPREQSLSAFYESYELSALTIGTTHLLGDGSSFKAEIIHPGQQATISLQLDKPLSSDSQLVVFVRPMGGSSRYGWCRWYRLAYAAPAAGASRD